MMESEHLQQDVQTTRSIYKTLSKKIEELLSKIQNDHETSEINEAMASSREMLSSLNDRVQLAIAELEENSEWNTYTVALFGETNAGKSTVIEMLRLVLNERKKNEEWNKFKSILSGSNTSLADISDSAISDIQLEMEGMEKERLKIIRRKSDLEKYINEIRAGISEYYGVLDSNKREINYLRNFIRKIIGSLYSHKAMLDVYERNYKASVSSLDKEAASLDLNIKNLGNELSKRKKISDQLHRHADGAIIGDGMHDFTRNAAGYTFDSGETQFILLDVPGIEGNESEVISSIGAAVKKAHAVFYVTPKALAPQKGDENKPGTIDKIRMHLASQTEVWSIYNKRVNNLRQLPSDSLVGKEEQLGLNQLDSVMREYLGENYQGVLSICGYPAFLASSKCLVPGSKHWKDREKFLKSLDAEEILRRSGANAFVKHISTDMIKDHKSRIAKANLKKVKSVVIDAANTISALKDEVFSPLKRDLRKYSKDSSINIDRIFSSFVFQLEAERDRSIGQFKVASRNALYKYIESGRSNDEVKAFLEKTIKEQFKDFENDIKKSTVSIIKSFQKDVSDVVKRFHDRSHELVSGYKEIFSDHNAPSLSMVFNVDNGIDKNAAINVGIAAIGAVISAFNPVGWLLIAFSVLNVVFQIYKSVRSYFNEDYKKAQQRKAVDDNVVKFSKKIKSSFDDSISENKKVISDSLDKLKAGLSEREKDISTLISILSSAKKEMLSSVKNI